MTSARSTRARPALAAALALAAAAALAGCSSRPFVVPPPSEAVELLAPYQAARQELGPHDYDPTPRPISLCYSTQLNDLEEVMARARSLCPNGGALRYYTEDAFFNGCGLAQPNRVTFICTPGPQPDSPYE